MKRIIPLICLLGAPACAPAQTEAITALTNARLALQREEPEKALELAQKAVKLAPKDKDALFVRGEAYSALRKHKEAIADYSAVLKIDPKFDVALDRRGGEHFKAANIKESIRDFEAYLEKNPDDFPRHWRYGIACYYADRFKDGAKQFKAGEVVFGSDVENVFWHYLCNVKVMGVEKARAAMLEIPEGQKDTRIPMMEIYKLIQGKSTAEKVIAKAADKDLPERGKRERMFYAHLYVGLNYAGLGEEKKALEHLKKADELQISHYMWDVGHVHLALAEKK